jgi:hypothetical protein
VFGRSQTRREVEGSDTPRLRLRRVQRKEWPVLIRDQHPGYISFEQFLANQHRMQENTAMTGKAAASIPGPRGKAALCCKGWRGVAAAGGACT